MLVDRIGLDQSATIAARNLLGSYLVRDTRDGLRRGRIVETEAYSENDPASQSCWAPPGRWYVYKCYGIHWMLNVVTGRVDNGEAVLIRAVEPEKGEGIMRDRRGQDGIQLTNGPGKLAEAFDVDDRFNEESVQNSELYLEPGEGNEPIYESPRVGIDEATERYWRFFCESEFCSDVTQNDYARRRN
jgi:DNA-3-methyladenine glycosylase